MSIPVFAIVKNGKIEPITPIDLPEGTSLLILPNPTTDEATAEAIEWAEFSINGLARAYSDDEPEYEISSPDDDRIMQLFLDFITTAALKNHTLVPYTIALSETAHSLIAGIELDYD